MDMTLGIPIPYIRRQPEPSTGRIVTGGDPLDLKGTKPIFVPQSFQTGNYEFDNQG
ncbi:hypothetical protein [Sphingobacterium athyrii]|uniref:hypothetical protein n=1 Tax=Sphingobacterium athyrii TaxID=2152717 RepID=UPI0015E861B1|nr:hypothetical protein [Sphingobacterium athyrii]